MLLLLIFFRNIYDKLSECVNVKYIYYYWLIIMKIVIKKMNESLVIVNINFILFYLYFIFILFDY